MTNWNNTIRPPLIQYNGHLQTIIPSVFRKVTAVHYQRERIATPDDDFLDLDWSLNQGRKLTIISHGLEGSSDRSYVQGMADTFARQGWDVLAWNYRGCSGEINKQLRFYHSGATDDLQVVIDHARQKGYREIHLIGFSLGGNLTLKYLGERGKQVPAGICKAMVFSVPLDLHGSALQLTKGFSRVYAYRFLRKLKAKVHQKARLYPDAFDLNYLEGLSSLIDFDDACTAPLHGFESAVHYYQQCSAQRFMGDITIPTMIVNAQNDPFLSAACYPKASLRGHPQVQLHAPQLGGHVGFRNTAGARHYYSEEIAWKFLSGERSGWSGDN